PRGRRRPRGGGAGRRGRVRGARRRGRARRDVPGHAARARRWRGDRRARGRRAGLPLAAGGGRMRPPVVVLTGVSGSGKTTALHALEDIGFFTVDNVPPRLWPDLVALLGDEVKGVAVGIDIRAGHYLADAPGAIADLRNAGYEPAVVYLDANDDVLVRRYNFTRRTHPISQGTLTADLATERKALEPLRALAQEVIDTTATSARALTQKVRERFQSARDLRNAGYEPAVVYLDANDDVLVRRYNFTRRTHPISQGTLTADLATERKALEPLRALAQEVIDTTATSARALTQKVRERFQ